MNKKTTSKVWDWINKGSTILVIIFILFLIGLFFFKFDNLQQILQGRLDLETDYEPEKKSSCTRYDIAQEFRNAYGDANIDNLKNGCTLLNGVWKEEHDELSCFWNPNVGTVNCDSESSQILEDYCENDLKANWHCDNSIAFSGCLCRKYPPSNWNDDDDDNGDGDDGDDNGDDGDGGDTGWTPYENANLFVTSRTHNGEWFNGIVTASEECQDMADNAGLSGTWKAAMSSGRSYLKDIVPNQMWFLVDGTMVATNTDNLFNGALNAQIRMDENGNVLSLHSKAWTGTLSDGRGSFDTCSNWYQSGSDRLGTVGATSAMSGAWLDIGDYPCNHEFHWYCYRDDRF